MTFLVAQNVRTAKIRESFHCEWSHVAFLVSKLSKILPESSHGFVIAKLHKTPVPWQRFRSFTNVNPNFRSSHKKKGDTPSSSLKCAFDSSSPLHSIKVYGKHSPEQLAPLIVLNQFRVSETTRMGELRKSIICSVTVVSSKAPSVPRTITVTRDAHAGP